MGETSTELEDDLRECLRGREEERVRRLQQSKSTIDRFLTHCAPLGVTLSAENFDYLEKIGVVATSPGLLSRLMGDIEADKDGLYPMDLLRRFFSVNPRSEGYLDAGNYLAMAHPHFRRGCREALHWAPRFVEKIWTFNVSNADVYLALDPDRVRIDVTGSYLAECDTWYGAAFSEKIEKIPLGAVKLRPPSYLIPRHVHSFFADAYAFDVIWTQRDNIKTFQALELKSEDVQMEIDRQTVFPARYIHAEYDLAARSFRHLDGAMQYLSFEHYFARRDSDFNVGAKQSTHLKAPSKKLFKINGEISIANFVEFTSHFCAGNPLVIEYFSGEYPEHVVEVLGRIRGVQERPGKAG